MMSARLRAAGKFLRLSSARSLDFDRDRRPLVAPAFLDGLAYGYVAHSVFGGPSRAFRVEHQRSEVLNLKKKVTRALDLEATLLRESGAAFASEHEWCPKDFAVAGRGG
jgi:hypothetical protein